MTVFVVLVVTEEKRLLSLDHTLVFNYIVNDVSLL